jgi:hypothetical protein
MSDQKPDAQDTPSETTQDETVDGSRRKLTGAALGASAVFTLASRPVWASQCSISGMASGNLSAPHQETCEGCTPGYWMVCQHLSNWVLYSPTDTFNSVFGVTNYVDCKGTPYTLLDVMYLNGNGYSCGPGGNKDANPEGPLPTCSNGKAFGKLGGDPVSENLGFHAVAALLNAAHPNVNYGYTPAEVINLFQNSVFNGQGAALKDALDMLNNRGCPL